MRRVLVPLDGSDLAASIVPEALRVAGSQGELVLIRVVSRDEDRGVLASDEYLAGLAQSLRTKGVSTQTATLVNGDVAQAIDEAVGRSRSP